MEVRSRATALLEAVPAGLRGTVVSAAELVRRRRIEAERPPLATGITALDEALGGGFPRGALIELVGRGSSGRLSAALAALAVVTTGGDIAAMVDRGGSLDPGDAAALGVDLRRLLWVCPERLPAAVTAAEELTAAGFPLVVLEAGVTPLTGRAPVAAWLRLARLARLRDAVVLVSAPYRLSGPAAEAVLRLAARRAVWRGRAVRVLAGIETRLSLDKARGGRPGRTAIHRWLLPDAALTDPDALPATVHSTVEEVSHAAG